jgi:uncharacterized membrane protein
MEGATIQSGKAISYGWASVKKDFWYFVGLSFVSTVIGSIGSSDRKRNDGWDLLGFLLSAWMTCGYTKLALSYERGQKLPFGELFTQWKYYWRVLGATFLLGLIVGIGFVLLIVPGIYLALRFQFTVQLIIDKDLGIMEAMRQSTKLTEGKKMALFGFDLTMFGVILLGAICLGVGIFVSMPVVWLASVFMYRRLSEAPQPTSPATV